MVLRSERHRELLLATINNCQYPGGIVHEIVELKAEVATASLMTIKIEDPPNGNGSAPGELSYRPDEAMSHRTG